MKRTHLLRSTPGILVCTALLASGAAAQARWRPHKTPWSTSTAITTYDFARREVVRYGGSSAANTWVLRDGRWQQMDTPVRPRATMAVALAFDVSRGTVLLFGGSDGVRLLNETWEWNGAEWRELYPVTSPPARQSAALCSDLGRGRVVMFGGFVSATPWVLGDTWEWDGSN
ncbi:MAG: hypothetical protein U1F36_09385 [Planctomycetota bacterium]